jgi:DNA-binding HxlR family transcriptional regulator
LYEANMKMQHVPNVAARIFIGRWTPRILFSLKKRSRRHGELRRDLGNVSQRMLTRTLRNLESAGLIARRVMQSKPVSVEYSLTKLGTTMVPPLRGMCRWAGRHRTRVSAEVTFPGT